MYRLILPALLLLGGASALSADSGGYAAKQAARDRAELDKELTGFVPGKPLTCIDPRRATDTTRVGDTILYKVNGREIYRNDTNGGCYGLRSGDAIVTRSNNGELCRGDIVRTVDFVSHTESGSCVFGDFIPYKRP